MWNGVPEEDAVRALLEKAGPRAPLAEAELASLEAKAREEWRRRYPPTRPALGRRRWWLAAAAAALLAAIGLLWRARTPGPSVSPPPAASVALLSGASRLQAKEGPPVELAGSLAIGKAISEGSTIETAPEGRLALRTAGGASVRLDANTRIRLADSRLVELVAGTVYIDAPTAPLRVDDVAVQTPNGLFRPQGTQFEVRVEPGASSTRLRVREGTVVIEGRGSDAATAAGQELIVRADGSLAHASVAADDPSWRWAQQAAPMLAIEGRTVKSYLDWLERETGWRVEFVDREAASRADTAILHGSIDHLTPETSPGVVLSSGGLSYRVSDGTLAIFLARPKR